MKIHAEFEFDPTEYENPFLRDIASLITDSAELEKMAEYSQTLTDNDGIEGEMPFDVKTSILDNPVVTERIIRMFLNDKDVWVKAKIAGMKDIPKDVLEKLASDNSTVVLYYLLDNQELTSEMVDNIITRIANGDVINKPETYSYVLDALVDKIKSKYSLTEEQESRLGYYFEKTYPDSLVSVVNEKEELSRNFEEILASKDARLIIQLLNFYDMKQLSEILYKIDLMVESQTIKYVWPVTKKRFMEVLNDVKQHR